MSTQSEEAQRLKVAVAELSKDVQHLAARLALLESTQRWIGRLVLGAIIASLMGLVVLK